MQNDQTFTFTSYTFNPESRIIELCYRSGEQTFVETLQLPGGDLIDFDHAELDRALFSLHLIGGISYYKASCPGTITVESGELAEAQTTFWNTLYTKGLGEFAFENKLDLRDYIHFPSSETAGLELSPSETKVPTKVLSLFGGGKDSIATAGILDAAGVDYTLMRLGAHPIIDELFTLMDKPHLEVTRTLDPALFELNRSGALNGHVPITMYIASLNIVLAILFGYDAVAISSERSSSYGNVFYLGGEINHQWSKSAEFEGLFRDYLASYVTTRVQYINLLARMSELQISKLVVARPKYLPHITSCNVNWKLLSAERLETATAGLWCGKCPKCAFTFTLLCAWLPVDEVTALFGRNLFDARDNVALYRELFGLAGFKPFECVGTPEEMLAAAFLANKQQPITGTLVGQLYTDEILPKYPDIQHLVDEAMALVPAGPDEPAYVAKWLEKSGVIT